MAQQPDSTLAQAVLPAPLLRALRHVFAQGISGAMLVGGTALAGYYAGHRRSDDLDLFVKDTPALRATVLAVQSLATLGAETQVIQNTAQFYDAQCRLDEHAFTVQVVLDPHLFVVGTSIVAPDGVAVADLDTLLRQKSAALLSRCSEKDLYDMGWLFDTRTHLTVTDLITLGATIDGGMSAEALLISVTGTRLRLGACDFSRNQTDAEVLDRVTRLRRVLADSLHTVARNQPPPPLAATLKALKKRRR